MSTACVRRAAGAGHAEVRFANGQFQTFQVIGVDDATLAGVPVLNDGPVPTVLRAPDAALVDSGGTEASWRRRDSQRDQWPHGAPHLLRRPGRSPGDELLVNDHASWWPARGGVAALPAAAAALHDLVQRTRASCRRNGIG